MKNLMNLWVLSLLFITSACEVKDAFKLDEIASLFSKSVGDPEALGTGNAAFGITG